MREFSGYRRRRCRAASSRSGRLSGLAGWPLGRWFRLMGRWPGRLGWSCCN